MSSEVVLYGEDDENDAFLLANAFRRVGIPQKLVNLDDGRAVIDYLSGEGPYGDRQRYPLPRLVLLDLKMPAVTGLEVLRWIQGPPRRVAAPTVVLSSSGLPQDRDQAREFGAHAYYVKPARLEDMVELARQIHHEWLH